MNDLTDRALHQAAIAQTGLCNFGDSDYLGGLRRVLQAAAERPPSEKLNRLVATRAVAALVGRLHSENGWRLHPEHNNTRITAPLVITGMSRSGTSALHQLLAMDEQFQWIPHWIAQAPTVRVPRDQWPSSPVYQALAAKLKTEYHSNPELRATHNIEADLPEECINVMRQSFLSMTFVTTVPLPRYYEWFIAQDETASYQRYAKNLRLIGALAADSKPWLLKNPSHTFGLEALLRVFPDARIIVTHRDPVQAVSSAASLTNIVSGDLWQPGEIGRLRMDVGLRNMERLQVARERHQEQFYDVDYRAFLADPMGVVQGIYRRFGLRLSSMAAAAMKNWAVQNPPGRFGQHRYATAELGLDADVIRSRFADYIKRYRLD